MFTPYQIMTDEVGRSVSVTPILYAHRHFRLDLCAMIYGGVVWEFRLVSRGVR